MSSDQRLERALTDLGAHLEYPQTPPLAETVAARLAEAKPKAEPKARAGQRLALPRPGRAWSRRRLVVVAVALLLVTAALLASPAVARRLGLRGVSIQLGGPTPSAPSVTATSRPPDAGRAGLGLGERVTLEQARQRVGFRILLPAMPELGPPDEVYVSGDIPDGRVDLVWLARPGLPASPHTGVGLLITQFRGQIEVKKVLDNPQAQVERLVVGGRAGYWIGGPAHGLFFYDRNGRPMESTFRDAGPTLVWESSDATVRLEGPTSRDDALRIANSMR